MAIVDGKVILAEDGEVLELRRKDNTALKATVEIVATTGIVLKSPALVIINMVLPTTDVGTGDDQGWVNFGPEFNGFDLVDVRAYHIDVGSGAGTTTIAIRRDRGGAEVEVLSTNLTIDSGERDHTTAATPAVINTANDDINTGDAYRVDVDAIPATTAPKGLAVHCLFKKP